MSAICNTTAKPEERTLCFSRVRSFAFTGSSLLWSTRIRFSLAADETADGTYLGIPLSGLGSVSGKDRRKECVLSVSLKILGFECFFQGMQWLAFTADRALTERKSEGLYHRR